jgi:septal ring-binding cell division protein DamX
MKYLLHLFICCLVINLASCGEQSSTLSLPAGNIEQSDTKYAGTKTQQQNAATMARFEQHLSQWQDAKLDQQRLQAMEQELAALKLLVIELKSMIKDQSVAGALPQDQLAEFKINELLATEPSISYEPAAASRPSFGLQLFSLRDKALLQPTWDKLVKKYPRVLGSLMPVYQATRIDNKIFYRVKGGEYSSAKAATKACTELKMLGGSCIQSNFKGVRF